MSGTIEKPVSDSDFVQLSRLVTEHAWRLENGKADSLHELYTEDGEIFVLPTPFKGHDDIKAWGEELIALRPWKRIRHVCSNMRFVQIDENTAEGTSTYTVFMLDGSPTSGTVPWSVGEDHDRFVKTKDGWRFAERRWNELFASP